MRKNLYGAFTLVEMLIVMGILIILMAVGITAGRFAINRANDVAHQNAADQIYTALQAYYTDNRQFPVIGGTTNGVANGTSLGAMIETGALSQYLDNGAFNGGTTTTFYYGIDTETSQVVLICVAKGGQADAKHLGVYCTGNGFGSADISTLIDSKDVVYDGAAGSAYMLITGQGGFLRSDWDGKDWAIQGA